MSDIGERVAAAIAAFGRGEIIIVTDDDDRENEGDLILAAVHATPEKIGFIVRHTSGIVCTPIPPATARRLQLQPMVADNTGPQSTAFTVSVDFGPGLTTGISAEERCNTVRAIANPNAGADEFVRPGHVFPLVARDGGVLMRSGHTEAAVDLCRLAELPEVGVLAELVNDDGTVMRGAQVTDFGTGHGLHEVSVADLIAWRQRREKLVDRVANFSIATFAGPAEAFSYRTPYDATQHLAIVFGEIGDGNDVPVRLHLEAVAADVFGKGRPLDDFVRRFADEGRGVIIYLREDSVGVAKSAMRARDRIDQPESPSAVRDEEWREIGLGAQILRDLGVNSIRLFASRERRYIGVEGFGIAISATETIEEE